MIPAAGTSRLRALPLQRDLFEIPDGVTFLNCANLAPQLRSVTAAGLASVRAKVSPWEITPPDWFTDGEILRSLAGQVIGADAESMALVPSVSYGLAVAAANVRVERGQTIVLLHEEFPSNVYIWREVARRQGAVVLTLQRNGKETWTEALLGAIDSRTAVVAIPNCHWTDGGLIDLEKVSEKTHAVGAALVIDASQSMGACPMDIEKIQPDFLVAVGYKWLLGPYSLGYLYVSPRWRSTGTPIEYTWLARKGSEDFTRLVDYRDEYRTGGRRFDAGEFSNFVLVPMAIASLRQILAWKVEHIQSSVSALTGLIARNAENLGYVTCPEEERVGHIIGIKLPKGIPEGLGKNLAERRVYVSIRGDIIRVSPHLYNDEADVEKLFHALHELTV